MTEQTINYPELTGTPKQIAWANDIRRAVVGDVPELPVSSEHKVVYEQRARQLVETYTSAVWWIEHRHMDTRRALRTRSERGGGHRLGEGAWDPEKLEI